MKLTVVLAIVASILFAVACGGGKDVDAPTVAVKVIAPTDTPEPTSTPNTVSPQSLTPPPMSMVLETVSPELLSCVQTALGDEQYNAIISGRQDAVSEQLGIVLSCILQYPQEANAIMEMFGLDMGTIMAASTPGPNTQAPIPTNTPVPQPTNTPKLAAVFVTKWGTQGSGDGQFSSPIGVAVALDGSVYVTDAALRRIQKFTSSGVFVSNWGTNGTGDGEFNWPYGVTVASDGSVYVADIFNNRIQKFTVGE